MAGHLPVLDGVRGLAILGVLLFHFVSPENPEGSFDHAVSWLFAYGALGVDLFFLLSGFLITGILYDSRRDAHYFRNFYMRRVLRIFPLYYGVLAVVFLIAPLIPPLRGSEIAGLRDEQAWAWLYGVNIYLALHGGWVLSYLTHFWSLAIEEQFYLVWPLVVWLLSGTPRFFMRFALAVAIASFGARVVASLLGVNPVATTVLTPFQLDSLALGAFVAVYVRQPEGDIGIRRLIVPMMVVGIVLLVLQFAVRHFSEYGNSVLAVRSGAFHVLLAALMLKALTSPASSGWTLFFGSRPMTVLGKYSYGLYVYHHFISHYYIVHGTERALSSTIGSHLASLVILAVVGMAASMLIAWLSYEYFERYFLQLKRFWTSTSASQALPAANGKL